MTTLSPTDTAVQRFIAQSRIVRIATRSPKGNPDIIPLWYVYSGGRLYLSTRAENPVVRDLLVNPEVVLLLDGERRDEKVLRLRGRATFNSGARFNRQLAFGAARRYYGPGGLWNFVRHWRQIPARARYLKERTGETGVIEIVPESAEFLSPISHR